MCSNPACFGNAELLVGGKVLLNFECLASVFIACLNAVTPPRTYDINLSLRLVLSLRYLPVYGPKSSTGKENLKG